MKEQNPFFEIDKSSEASSEQTLDDENMEEAINITEDLALEGEFNEDASLIDSAEDIEDSVSDNVHCENRNVDKREKKSNDQEPAEESVKTTVVREVWEWIKILVVAAVCAFVINNVIIANSTVPTGSMENTIMTGARVFGSRLSYTFGDVKRGDIAIFIYGYRCKKDGIMYRENKNGACPQCGREDKKNTVVYYVKRVIGMPGDHVEIRQTGFADVSEITKFPVSSSNGKIPVGTVYVNGEAIAETYLPEPMIVNPNVEVNASGSDVMFPPVDVTVPEGYYYCLGDNRNNSEDARYWGENNFVARDRMIAKVYVKYWPLNDIGLVK